MFNNNDEVKIIDENSYFYGRKGSIVDKQYSVSKRLILIVKFNDFIQEGFFSEQILKEENK